MALFKILQGASSGFDNNPSSNKLKFNEGYCYFIKDKQLFYVDYYDSNGNAQRKALNAVDAQTLTGASLKKTLNDSDNEIPTSKVVFGVKSKLNSTLTALDQKLDNSILETKNELLTEINKRLPLSGGTLTGGLIVNSTLEIKDKATFNNNVFIKGTSTVRDIIPETDSIYTLGNYTHKWKNIFVGGDEDAGRITTEALDLMTGGIRVKGGIAATMAIAADNFYIKDKARIQYDTTNEYIYFTFE